jgi:hypothetical protein
MKKFFKVIELLLSEEDEAFLDSISIVDKPAIERNFYYFSEDKPVQMWFNDDKMIVTGPAMIPDQRIPRTGDDGEVYFVYFSPDTIRLAADLFLKKNKASKNNVNHVPVYTDKLHVFESWIKESQNDKSVDYGFGDLPVGTWFVSMKVDDMETWQKIKEGKLNGLSVEGAFMYGQEQLERMDFARYKAKYTDIRRRYRKAYKGLSEEEKRNLDTLIYMLEEIGTDEYDDANEAIARSKQIGLEGRIHSHTEDGKTYYMPGSNHEEYEVALLNMEVDVSALPDYVNPGATGNIQSEFAKVSFDWDDTLSTYRGKQLFEEKKQAGDTLYIISARQEVSDTMRNFALQNQIPLSRVYATGSNEDKVDLVRRLGIDKHIDNNATVVSELGSKGEKFVAVNPGESKEDYIGRCMSALQGEYPEQDQRYAVCITEWDNGSFSAGFAESYTDYPEAAVDNAKRALVYAEENGWGDCGTPIGKMRANQLAKKEPISEDTIARMAAFERHRQNSKTPYGEGCGKLMWDAWGGSEGIEWAQRKLAQIRGEEFAERPIARIPEEERGRTGSDKNEPGDTTTSRGGIEVSAEVEKTLKDKIAKHNEENPQDSQKADLGMLKAVWRRGAGAYSVGTPGRRGMTRAQWAMGRVNAFLKILSGSAPSDKDYTQDNDLLPKSHPKYSEQKN